MTSAVARLSSSPPAAESGTPQLLTCARWPEARYYLSTPAHSAIGAPVLVSVHGISRNADELAATFAAACERLGWIVVAPLFSEEAFPRYQQLGFSRRLPGPRPDLALNAILDEVGRATGARTDRVFLFGYSGGGQFVHRYALLHPRRVLAMALGAPGWYTFPDPRKSYPCGLAAVDARLGADVDLAAFLRLPTSVIVGAKDRHRDSSLNATPRVDRQQGLTRQERGRRWVEAVRRAAAARGLPPRIEYLELSGCGHSFCECMRRGHMDLRALDFFARSRRSARPRSSPSMSAREASHPAAFLC